MKVREIQTAMKENEGTLDRNRNLVLQQATYESLKACVAEMFLNVERA